MKNYLLAVMVVTFFLTNVGYADVKNADSLQSDKAIQDLISDGDKLINKGSYLAAADAYKKALALDPQNGNAFAGLGMIEYTTKNFRKAIESFEKAEEYGLHGHWVEGAYAGHGYSLLKLGEYDKAIKVFEKLKVEFPQTHIAYLGLSTAYLRTNNMEEFIKNSEKLVELEPDVISYFSLGQGYLSLKNYDKAKENFLKARQIAERTANTDFLKVIDELLNHIPT